MVEIVGKMFIQQYVSLPEKKASENNFVSSACFENFVIILVSSACMEKFTKYY